MKLTPEVTDYFNALKCGSNNLVTSEELFKMIEEKKEMFILDIRKKEDFDEQHIPTSIHCPWGEVGEFIEDDVFKKDEQIIVVCYSGQTAGQTVGILRALGFKACSLKGGINLGWKNDELPLEASCNS